MKASAFWLPTAMTVLALTSVETALAEKRVRSAEAARQELDLLTAEKTSGAAANQSGPANPESMAPADYGQPNFLDQTEAAPHQSKWSNIKKQAARVVSNVVRASQAAGYLPPNVGIRQTMTAANGYLGTRFAPSSAATYAGAFRHIQSGIVSLDVPFDWEPMPPVGGNISFVSQQGESFSFGKLDIFADQASMRNATQVAQLTGTANREILVYMQRMVSPPLSPEQIVARLLPQISGGAMQNVRIRSNQRPPYGDSAVVYDYVLLPQQDALTRDNLPPALQRARQVSMRGEIRIMVMPGMPVGVSRTWTFMYAGASAPNSIFTQNAAIYSRIFQSMRFDNNAAQRDAEAQEQMVNSVTSGIKSQQQQIQDFTRRYKQNSEQQIGQFQDFNQKTGNIWIDMAGQQTRVVDPTDPNYTGFVPWGSQPSNSRPVNCPAISSEPGFVDNTKATPTGCTDLQPYR
jgi:hypothetical protein